MLVSLITPVLNGEDTIEETIKSVLSQVYKNVEYIIIDGGSTDSTLDVIKKYSNKISKLVSEKDSGVYDAMNKGIRMSSGDIIGILNSDDIYANDFVLETVVKAMSENHTNSCYGDLMYVHRKDTNKIIRYWKPGDYKKRLLRKGWMLPHPTFFVKKWVYEKYGLFDLSFRIAADYELMVRFIEKYGISTCYVPEVLVKMRIGGRSNKNLKNMMRKSLEDYRARQINYAKGGIGTILLKNISKIPQFFIKKG